MSFLVLKRLPDERIGCQGSAAVEFFSTPFFQRGTFDFLKDQFEFLKAARGYLK